MSEKHTPGPWHLEQHDPRAAILSSIGICAGDPAGDPNDINVLGYASCEVGTTAENVANAQLWAASPDLLAACRESLEFVEGILARYHVQRLYTQLEKAIAKATGEPFVEPSSDVGKAQGD